MRDVPFGVCAAASLAVHLGLAGLAMLGRVAPPAPTPAGAGDGHTPGASAAIAGETFEVTEQSEPQAPAGETAVADPNDPTETTGEANATRDAPLANAAAPDAPDAPATTHRARSRRGRRATSASPDEATAASPAAPPPALYGAVGDRAAADLVTSFKRSFPLAVSSDPIWQTIPVGFYAAGDVALHLAEDGTLTSATVDAAAAPAFRAAIARTVAMIKHRSFTARGARTRLHMVVRVTDQLAHAGRFAIDAQGSFELPSGRHVQLAIVER